MEPNATEEQRILLGRMLCATNKNTKNNREYALLIANINNLDDNIRFFYDPNSELESIQNKQYQKKT